MSESPTHPDAPRADDARDDECGLLHPNGVFCDKPRGHVGSHAAYSDSPELCLSWGARSVDAPRAGGETVKSLFAFASRAYVLLDNVTDDDECVRDHHGNCQTHLGERECSHAAARKLLDDYSDTLDEIEAALPSLLERHRDGERGGIYVASRSKHGEMWRQFRTAGYPIISTWIDESGEGETSDWPDLWRRCIDEARSASAVVLYAPLDDGELKGALIEVGAALAANRPVYFVGDGAARRYSWLAHPNVTVCEHIRGALRSARSAPPSPERASK